MDTKVDKINPVRDNVLSLKDYKDRKPPSGEANWLAELPEGTIFLTKRRWSKEPELHQFSLVKHFRKSTLLYVSLNVEAYVYEETEVFSKAYELIEVLGVVLNPAPDEGEAGEEGEDP